MMDHTRDQGERGAALLSILFIVAAMSVVALLAVEAITRATRLATITTDRTETFWYVRSSEAAGSSLVSELLRVTEGRLIDITPRVGEPITFPLEEGVIVAQIDEASNCFNLNALAEREEAVWVADVAALTSLKQTLEAHGFGGYEADELADAIADWIDTDSSTRPNGAEDNIYTELDPAYRSAGGPLDNMRELLSIAPFTPERYLAVQSILCVRPSRDQSVLNVNTLRADQTALLTGLFSAELEPEAARRLIEERPLGGWPSAEAFINLDPIQQITASEMDTGAIDIVSRYFGIRGQVSVSQLATRFELLYEVDNTGRGALVWRRYGDE